MCVCTRLDYNCYNLLMNQMWVYSYCIQWHCNISFFFISLFHHSPRSFPIANSGILNFIELLWNDCNYATCNWLYSITVESLWKFVYLFTHKWMTIFINSGIVIPLPAVIMALSIEKQQYKLRLTVCVPSADIWFHSTTLVFTILLGAGICFLMIIFFIIHRVSIISNTLWNITCFIAIEFNDTIFLCN